MEQNSAQLSGTQWGIELRIPRLQGTCFDTNPNFWSWRDSSKAGRHALHIKVPSLVTSMTCDIHSICHLWVHRGAQDAPILALFSRPDIGELSDYLSVFGKKYPD